MAKFLQIQIPETCTENWSNMTPHDAGRHCASCNKSVIDFTGMSDAQLIAFLQNRNDKICGRFYGDQLNKEIPIPKKTFSPVKYFFMVTIPAFLLSVKADAQQTKNKPEISLPEPSLLKLRSLPENEQQRIIKGRVLASNNEPLSGATINSEKYRTATIADKNGYFTLHINQDEKLLRVSYVGYKIKEINIETADSFQVVLDRSEQAFMGDFDYAVVESRYKKKVKPKPAYAAPSKKNELLTPLKNEISIYPNPVPANSVLTISWKNKVKGEQSIEIFSASGDLIQTDRVTSFTKTNTTSVLLKNISGGFYIIRITDVKTNVQISKELIVR